MLSLLIKWKVKMQLDIFSQFQVSIIVQIVFLLKLYLFTAQINDLFCCFNKVEK